MNYTSRKNVSSSLKKLSELKARRDKERVKNLLLECSKEEVKKIASIIKEHNFLSSFKFKEKKEIGVDFLNYDHKKNEDTIPSLSNVVFLKENTSNDEYDILYGLNCIKETIDSNSLFFTVYILH